jgi:Protein of unknown function (DUF2934)
MPALRKTRVKPAMAQPFLQDIPPVSPSDDLLLERIAMIADAAYFRAEKRNFAPGYELEDWVAAEREIDALLAARDGAAPRH